MSSLDSEYITVTIDLRVYNIAAFVEAARGQAIKDGVDPSDLDLYTADNLDGCAQMLLDPGVSPPGGEILGSSASWGAS